jgi:predicted dehydrogenase
MIDGRAINVTTPDNVQLLIDFGDACFAAVTSGFVMQQYRGPALELYGATGAMQMLGDDWDPDGYELWQNDVGAWMVYKETDPAWPWTDGLRHMVECIRHSTRPLPTAEHARHVLEIMLAAEASGSDGMARDIRSRFPPLPLLDSEAAEPTHLMHDRTRQKFDVRKHHSDGM